MFIGEIKSVSDAGFVMTTVSDKRSDQTVVVSSDAKLTNRKGAAIAKADLVVGHKVRVRGLWGMNVLCLARFPSSLPMIEPLL
jgi:hypothetical protein